MAIWTECGEKPGRMMRYGTGVALVVVAATLWSLMGLGIRQIEEAGTWTVLFWRSVGSIPILMAFIYVRSGGQSLARFRGVGVAGIIGGMGLVLAFAGAIYAIQSTTIANAVFFFSASPFLAAILGWIILREPVRSSTWLAIGLAIIGLYIMVSEGISTGAFIGNIAALLSALGFAIFSVALRWGRQEDMLPAVVLGGVFSALVAVIVLVAQGQGVGAPMQDILISMAIGAIILALGMVLYTLGSQVIPAAELTLISTIEVMLAPLWVWLIMGETASRNTLLGGAVLLTAICFNAIAGARQKRQAA